MITLGIIGIVAALTMPSLIANYQKAQFEAGVKKMASVVGQAVTKLMADEGVNKVTETSLLYSDDIDKCDKLGGEFLDKYLNVVSKCETYEQCFGEAYKSANKNITDTTRFTGYFVDGRGANSCRLLADGTSICMRSGYENYNAVDVMFDLNGNRMPNRAGYDLFYFSIYYDGSISERPPECRKDESKCVNSSTLNERMNDCLNNIYVFGYGAGCFTYLQQNGFKIDY